MQKENLPKIKSLEDQYGLQLFSMALTHLFDVGHQNLTEENVASALAKIKASGEEAAKNGTVSIMSPDFHANLIRCAAALSRFSIWDLFAYVKSNIHIDGIEEPKAPEPVTKADLCDHQADEYAGFKDYEVFKNYKDAICYGTESVEDLDDLYTKAELLELCEGDEAMAERLFHACEWQHPETIMDEWEREDEVARCSHCGRLYLCYEKTSCPHCGFANSDEQADPDAEPETAKHRILISVSGGLVSGVFINNYETCKVNILDFDDEENADKDGLIQFFAKRQQFYREIKSMQSIY